MADIELVIKIPEDEYNIAKYGQYGNINVDTVRKALANGTPLPEHHGRLIDADALEEYFKELRKKMKASDYKNGTEFFVRDEMLLNVAQYIHLFSPTIIEGSDAE
jgi:hypothetical protein